MTRFLPLVVVAAVFAACDIDFTEVAAPPEARLHVDVRFEGGPHPGLWLNGSLWPGTTEDGTTRGVINDTLYLGEQALPPRETTERGMREYRWDPGPEAEPGTLSITPPVVEGLAALPTVLFRLYHRVGEDTISAAPGDTLRFEIEPHPATADAPSSASWSFTLSSPGLALHRSDTTAVPALFTVPLEWLEWAGSDPIHVSLSIREVWRRELPDGEYSARIVLARQLAWTVLWTDSTE